MEGISQLFLKYGTIMYMIALGQGMWPEPQTDPGDR